MGKEPCQAVLPKHVARCQGVRRSFGMYPNSGSKVETLPE
jgi:hypothetical protein